MAHFNLKWGILATGSIAETFTKDLLVNPITRDVKDVSHTVVAAASSTSADRAAKFLKTVNAPEGAKPYGSYADLVADNDVDIIYIATPHSHHYQNTMLCLNAGKHVLCEKAFTVNEAQARKLYAVAKEKNLFLMEAVWTRFFPISIRVREMIQQGLLGDVHRVMADNSFGTDVEGRWGTDHRMVNMDLAGGALLDLGIYSLTWVFQTLYHTVPASSRVPPDKVLAMVDTYAATGADEKTSILVHFPKAPRPSSSSSSTSTSEKKSPQPPSSAQGIALTNFRVATDPDAYNTARPAIRIQGTLGEIDIDGPAYRPTTMRFIPAISHGPSTHYPGTNPKVKQEILDPGVAVTNTTTNTTKNEDGKGDGEGETTTGHGMFWEADECARCIRDGKIESEGMGWEESCVIMGVMDEVRRQAGIRFPDRIESLEYPLDL